MAGGVWHLSIVYFFCQKIYIFFLDIYQKRSISSNNNLDNCIARARQNYLEKSIHNFLFFWLILSYLRQYSFFLVVSSRKKGKHSSYYYKFWCPRTIRCKHIIQVNQGYNQVRYNDPFIKIKYIAYRLQSALCTYFLSNQHLTKIKICGKIPQRNMSQVQFALEIENFILFVI